jgi:hypothetical protein
MMTSKVICELDNEEETTLMMTDFKTVTFFDGNDDCDDRYDSDDDDGFD